MPSSPDTRFPTAEGYSRHAYRGCLADDDQSASADKTRRTVGSQDIRNTLVAGCPKRVQFVLEPDSWQERVQARYQGAETPGGFGADRGAV